MFAYTFIPIENKLIKFSIIIDSLYLLDPRGAGHAEAFQFLFVGPLVSLSVYLLVGQKLLSCPSIRWWLAPRLL